MRLLALWPERYREGCQSPQRARSARWNGASGGGVWEAEHPAHRHPQIPRRLRGQVGSRDTDCLRRCLRVAAASGCRSGVMGVSVRSFDYYVGYVDVFPVGVIRRAERDQDIRCRSSGCRGHQETGAWGETGRAQRAGNAESSGRSGRAATLNEVTPEPHRYCWGRGLMPPSLGPTAVSTVRPRLSASTTGRRGSVRRFTA